MSSTRRANEKDCERKPLPKEIEFPEDMVRKVIGNKGSTVQGIEERSGAHCYVHSPDDDDPRAYMTAEGSDEQVDKACEELKELVATKDRRYADRMQPTITMKLRDEDAEALTDQGKREMRRIERITGTSIRPQCEKEIDSCVRIVGPIGVVELARRLVQQLVGSLDQQSPTTEPHRSRRERESTVRHRDASQPVDIKEFLRDWPAEVTVIAHPRAFKCLIGGKGATIKKLQSECDAEINVQDLKHVIDDSQHADISGAFDDVMIAFEKVTECLRVYDPKRDDARPRDRRQDPDRNSEDLKEIKAEAYVKIFDDAMGWIIGKGGSNKKRIEDKTKASVNLDDEVDSEGLKTVEVTGESTAVLEALDEVKKSMKKYKPKSAKAGTRSPRSTSPPSRQRHSTTRRSREPY